ncbi:PAC2 family protein, partial [Corynebacterium variabile]
MEHNPVATFDVDALIDYRSRRPGVTIDRSRLTGSEDLSLTLHRLEDTRRPSFPAVGGPGAGSAVECLQPCGHGTVDEPQGGPVVALYAAPMTVPHTRPLVVSAHASDPTLVADLQRWESRMIIPGSAALRTELSPSSAGVDTVGLTAHVPHYIAASDYPEAAYGLLHAVE